MLDGNSSWLHAPAAVPPHWLAPSPCTCAPHPVHQSPLPHSSQFSTPHLTVTFVGQTLYSRRWRGVLWQHRKRPRRSGRLWWRLGATQTHTRDLVSFRRCINNIRNIVTRSRNQCCSGKAIKYYILRVYVCSLGYPACNAHATYCHLWPARLYNIFPHYPINGTIFGKKSYWTQSVSFDCD